MGGKSSIRSAVGLSMLASLVAACGVAATPSPDGPPTGSATPVASSDSYDRLVLQAGQHVSASGRVVAVPGRPVRFCAPVAEAAVGFAKGHEPAPTYCAQGVDVQGVNLQALMNRREKDGAVEGLAALDVTYDGQGSVSVVHQGRYRDANDAPEPPDRVPCPAPAGGWPVGAADENLDVTAMDDYAHAHPEVVVTSALLRPSTTQAVAYVLTTTDAAPVAAALGPAYGTSLCVVRSRFTQTQISHADDAFTALMQHGPVYVVGAGGLGPDAQPIVDVELTAVTPKIAALADRQPSGLVKLEPWLAPSR